MRLALLILALVAVLAGVIGYGNEPVHSTADWTAGIAGGLLYIGLLFAIFRELQRLFRLRDHRE